MWLDLGNHLYLHKNWNPSYYNSHSQAASRKSDKIAINKQVCFLPTLSNCVKPKQILWGHWGVLIGWSVVLNCSTGRLFMQLMVWSGLLWPSVWHAGIQLGQLCLLAVLLRAEVTMLTILCIILFRISSNM